MIKRIGVGVARALGMALVFVFIYMLYPQTVHAASFNRVSPEDLKDTPQWIDITTIRYDDEDYKDTKWDENTTYLAKGKSGKDDCSTYLVVGELLPIFNGEDGDASNWPINLSTEDLSFLLNPTGAGDAGGALENDMGNAKKVVVFEVTNKSSIDNVCEYSFAQVEAEDSTRARVWFGQTTTGLQTFYRSGESNELPFLGSYTKSGDDPNLYEQLTTCGSKITRASSIPGFSPPEGFFIVIWSLRIQNPDGDGCIEQGSVQLAVNENPPSDAFAQPIDSEADAGGDTGPSCETSQGGLGWIVCGVVQWFIDRMEELVEEPAKDLLFAKVDNSADSPLHKAWDSFRIIANVFFVIAFMVVIFGQAGSMGMDSYTVKKMLPRIVIGVIAVQLSFFIAQVFVDFSNVLGRGVDGLLATAIGGDVSVLQGSIFGGGLQGSLGNLAAAGALIYLLIVTLPTILLGLLAVYFTLIIRLALIAILIVVAPVAFAAWILPNTEFAFRKWSSTFLKLLMMFPIIILLLSAGKFAGGLLVSGSVSEVSSARIVGPLTAIASIVLNVAPYFLIPFTFGLAGKGIAAIGSAATNFGNKAIRNKEGGLRGSPGARLNRYRQNVAAGRSRLSGNRFARSVAAPTTVFSRRRREHLASAGVNATMKEMDDNKLSAEAAMLIGMTDDQFNGVGEEGDANYVEGYVRELERLGMGHDVQRLRDIRDDTAYSRWRNNAAGQQAGLLYAAERGLINGDMMRSADDETRAGWSATDRRGMVSALRRVANSQGRWDVTSGYAASGNAEQLDSFVHQLGTDELKKTSHMAAPDVAAALVRNLTSGNAERQARAVTQLGDTMHGRSGVDPELRENLNQQILAMESGTDPAQQELARQVRRQVAEIQEGYLPDNPTAVPPPPPPPATPPPVAPPPPPPPAP